MEGFLSWGDDVCLFQSESEDTNIDIDETFSEEE